MSSFAPPNPLRDPVGPMVASLREQIAASESRSEICSELRGSSGIRELFVGDSLRLGLFRARRGDGYFSRTAQVQGHNVVFPSTPLRIRWGPAPFCISDPSVINLYHDGDHVERKPDLGTVDSCAWVEMKPSQVAEFAERLRPRGSDPTRAPFSRSQVPSRRDVFVLRSLLFRYLGASRSPDPLLVEDAALLLFERATRSLHRSLWPSSSKARRAGLDLAMQVREVMVSHFREPMTLIELAARVHSSPYHLARTFRAATGTTIHRYRMELRLREALFRVLDGESDLTDLALDLGFSSHSHFSAAFRSAYGSPPSTLRP